MSVFLIPSTKAGSARPAQTRASGPTWVGVAAEVNLTENFWDISHDVSHKQTLAVLGTTKLTMTKAKNVRKVWNARQGSESI